MLQSSVARAIVDLPDLRGLACILVEVAPIQNDSRTVEPQPIEAKPDEDVETSSFQRMVLAVHNERTCRRRSRDNHEIALV